LLASPFDPQTLIGRWQFELTDPVRQHHRQRLLAKFREPGELEQAMAEVEREASSSAFEISAAGELTSYVDGVAYFRTTLDLAAGPVESMRIDKPTGPVTLQATTKRPSPGTSTGASKGESGIASGPSCGASGASGASGEASASSSNSRLLRAPHPGAR